MSSKRARFLSKLGGAIKAWLKSKSDMAKTILRIKQMPGVMLIDSELKIPVGSPAHLEFRCIVHEREKASSLVVGLATDGVSRRPIPVFATFLELHCALIDARIPLRIVASPIHRNLTPQSQGLVPLQLKFLDAVRVEEKELPRAEFTPHFIVSEPENIEVEFAKQLVNFGYGASETGQTINSFNLKNAGVWVPIVDL